MDYAVRLVAASEFHRLIVTRSLYVRNLDLIFACFQKLVKLLGHPSEVIRQHTKQLIASFFYTFGLLNADNFVYLRELTQAMLSSTEIHAMNAASCVIRVVAYYQRSFSLLQTRPFASLFDLYIFFTISIFCNSFIFTFFLFFYLIHISLSTPILIFLSPFFPLAKHSVSFSLF